MDCQWTMVKLNVTILYRTSVEYTIQTTLRWFTFLFWSHHMFTMSLNCDLSLLRQHVVLPHAPHFTTCTIIRHWVSFTPLSPLRLTLTASVNNRKSHSNLASPPPGHLPLHTTCEHLVNPFAWLCVHLFDRWQAAAKFASRRSCHGERAFFR